MDETSKVMDDAGQLARPVVIPADAYISSEYAAAEQERLFRKVWLQAGRIEDLREIGDFITYDIGPDSVIIVKSGESGLSAYHNVCPHRGRRLVDTPPGKRNARGTRKNFICGYHGWTFGLDGENVYLEHEDDWQGSLCDGRADLGKVGVETWGGWI